MSHFEKVGVIFITGLVAIILALSLFGSGKQEQENLAVLHDSSQRVADLPPVTVPPPGPRKDSPPSVKQTDTTKLLDAILHTGKPVNDHGAGAGLEPFRPIGNEPAALGGPRLRKGLAADAIDPNSKTIKPSPPADEPILDTSKSQEHVVAAGESFYTMARQYYHDPSKWALIRDANSKINPQRLRTGMKITIPPLLPKSPANPPVADLKENSKTPVRPPVAETVTVTAKEKTREKNLTTDGQRTYRVKKGDTLSQIAQSQLGSVKMLAKLQEANPALQGDRSLREGMSLKIPAIVH